MATPAQVAGQIRRMEVRGAAAIGLAAAQTLANHVQGLDGSPAQVWRRTLVAARRLDAARPTAVALHNCLGWVLAGIKPEPTVAAMKKGARETADLVGLEVRESRNAIAATGARQLRDGDVLLTHCHSTTVVAAIKAAASEGKALEVIATETRPFRQGLVTVAALSKAGIQCSLIVDSAVAHVLATRDVDAVLVGADTVANDGCLFNKIGTAGVASLAQRQEVPVYSAAGLHKFAARDSGDIMIEERPAAEVATHVPRGVRIFNPVFDKTPPDLVTGYLTEQGLASPAKAVKRNLRSLPPESVWK